MSQKNIVSVMAIYLGLFIMLPLIEMAAITSSLQGEGNGEVVVMKAKNDMECRFDYLGINTRGPTRTLPSGTPVYTVTVTNHCPTDCRIEHIHLKCGNFWSEIPIPPNIFRRVGPNDCLVIDGLPIGVANVVTFEYANHQVFDLPVSSMDCIQ